MASTVIDPIADELVALIDALTPDTKPYLWVSPAGDTDVRPAGIVMLPEIERVGPDLPEDHLGETDWRLSYPVVFIVDFEPNGYYHAQAAEVVEAWIKAVDADTTLDGSVQEAKVTSVAPPEYQPGEGRPYIQYATTVQVLAFV